MAPEFNYLSAGDYQTTSLVENQPVEKEPLVSKDESMAESTIRKSGDGESASDQSESNTENSLETEKLLKRQNIEKSHENLPTSVQ